MCTTSPEGLASRAVENSPKGQEIQLLIQSPRISAVSLNVLFFEPLADCAGTALRLQLEGRHRKRSDERFYLKLLYRSCVADSAPFQANLIFQVDLRPLALFNCCQ